MATPPNAPAAASAGPGETPTAAAEESTADTLQDRDIVEVDDQVEVDSAFGSDVSSNFTASLASSVQNYTYENGRRYHAYNSGEYIFPNDDKEQEREDMKHHVFQLVLGGRLLQAPIPSQPQRILDIGTGTGIWAIDVADNYPSAHVYGIDLSPIQPRWVPPNCSFVVDNAEDQWLYSPDQAFDFIHMRALSGAIKDWPKLYSQIFQHLKPGAWVESQDHDSVFLSDDDSVDKAKELGNWLKKIEEAAGKFGKVLNVGPKQKQWMLDAGFVDIREEIFKVPLGRWPKDKRLKEQGAYFQALTLDGLESITMALFTRVLKMSSQEVQATLISPRKELLDPALHLYVNFRFTYGRKPLAGEE